MYLQGTLLNESIIQFEVCRSGAPRASLGLDNQSITLKVILVLLLRPVRIMRGCGAYDNEGDHWIISHLCWLHCLFPRHVRVVEAVPLSATDEAQATEKLHILKMRLPMGPD